MQIHPCVEMFQLGPDCLRPMVLKNALDCVVDNIRRIYRAYDMQIESLRIINSKKSPNTLKSCFLKEIFCNTKMRTCFILIQNSFLSATDTGSKLAETTAITNSWLRVVTSDTVAWHCQLYRSCCSV